MRNFKFKIQSVTDKKDRLKTPGFYQTYTGETEVEATSEALALELVFVRLFRAYPDRPREQWRIKIVEP